jgi:hypothetical protein
MEWILILTAMHIDNPEDIPARVEFVLPSQEECIEVAESLDYWIKFKNFIVTAECSPVTYLPELRETI